MSNTSLDTALHALDLGGAQDVQVFPLEKGSALADHMVVASGTSSRHVVGLAERAQLALKEKGFAAPAIEGQGDGNWVLVDGGDIIIHIFRPEVRDYYHIEDLWAKKPTP